VFQGDDLANVLILEISLSIFAELLHTFTQLDEAVSIKTLFDIFG